MAKNDDLIRKIRAGSFRVNNGRVIRTINILRNKYIALRDIRHALPDIGEPEIIDSINFLQEEQYIRLRNIDTKSETLLSDAEYTDLEAKVTGKGIRLLGGSIPDDMVEV